MTFSQIFGTLREVDLVNAERDFALLQVFHATGVERGTQSKNFESFARTLRNFFAPAPKKTARALFAALKAKAKAATSR